MDIREILATLDRYYHESMLPEAEAYLCEMVKKAQAVGDKNTELTLQNELIGFYRDASRHNEALIASKRALQLTKDLNLAGTKEYATTLINVANALRAAKNYDAAVKVFSDAKACLESLFSENHPDLASLYNNLSLVYQEKKEYEKACMYLRKALLIVETNYEKTKDDLFLIRTAISKTNLAVSLTGLKAFDEAKKLLLEALSVFEGRSPSDFHYSAALAGYADILFYENDIEKAIRYYEMALSEINLHMGKNAFYDTVLENLEKSYERKGVTLKEGRNKKGLEICELYYNAFFKPVLDRNFKLVKPFLSIGLIGDGSECLGFDDALSSDHDFGPGFCIFVDDETQKTYGDALTKAYERLPKTFMGYKRMETKEASGRIGVINTKEFLQSLIGMDSFPKTKEEWLTVSEVGLAKLAGGKLFFEGSDFARERQRILTGYSDGVFMKRLAQCLGLMAQSGQYNLLRMKKRRDFVAVSLYKTRFVESTLKALHLLSGVYAPYEKWLYQSAVKNTPFKDICNCLSELCICPLQDTSLQDYDKRIEDICGKVVLIVLEKLPEIKGMVSENETYLMVYAQAISAYADAVFQKEDLVEKIVLEEWEAFDKVQNEGGRAGCQDDWETFSIMRRSQYYTWPIELLKMYDKDFCEAKKRGANLITEKYGRMMESTSPKEYEKIKDHFPVRSSEYIAISEAIIKIQVGWMEELSKRFPLFCGNARAIHTSQDMMWRTSYETYLRGEIRTYSEQTLVAYGRFVAEIARKNENLAELILEKTAHCYGYKSIQEAEEKLRGKNNE